MGNTQSAVRLCINRALLAVKLHLEIVVSHLVTDTLLCIAEDNKLFALISNQSILLDRDLFAFDIKAELDNWSCRWSWVLICCVSISMNFQTHLPTEPSANTTQKQLVRKQRLKKHSIETVVHCQEWVEGLSRMCFIKQHKLRTNIF